MSYRAVFVALLTLVGSQAHAQLIPSLDLGVAGGVNFASLDDAGSLELDNSTGYHIGAFADFSFLFASARTGLYYLRAGDIPGVGENGENGTISFITVPVDFQVQTPTPIVKAYALVGPEFRFPLQGIETFNREEVNIAANVGIGVKGSTPLVGPSGFLELRYARDFTGIRSDSGDDDVKVHLFMVRAGVGI